MLADDNFGAPGLITPSGIGGDPASCSLPPIRINELHYDNDGTDLNEAVEVIAPAGTDLAGWSIALYNGSATQRSVYATLPLSGVVADQGDGTGVVVVDGPSGGIQNGAPDGLALVDASGAVVEFLSYEGAFEAASGPAAGMTSTDIGAAEGSSTLPDQSLQRDASGLWIGPACSSFGELNTADPDEFCPVAPIDVKIHDIQGSGDTPNLLGQRVVIEGVVVGDEEGPSPALRGFFVQEEDADVDGDPTTSEGIFVFNFGSDEVSVGDVVRVEGTVDEFFGNTQLTDFVEVTVLDVAPRVATPAQLAFPLDSISDLEAYEGMAVTLSQTLSIAEYFNYDRFGDVVVALPTEGTDRPMNPTALLDEDSEEAAELADLNLLSRITIDDGITVQNPQAPIHPINRQLFSQDNSFRGGDQVTGLTGPIFYSFNLYRILPLSDGGFDSYVRTTRPEAPEPVGGDLTVGTLNALNYFLTLDDSGAACGPNRELDCRGADSADEFERQRVKLLNALEGMDADVIGLVEVENTAGVEPLADIVAGLNDRLGTEAWAYVPAGENAVVGTDAIKVGLIYRTDAVAQIGDAAVLDTPDFLDPNGTGSDKNRAAVAATFVDLTSGGVTSVTVNHLKSKGSGCGEGDDHPLAGSCNVTRTLAAERLAEWISTDPTGIEHDDWMIIGDLNSYDHENPIQTLEAVGYTDLVGQYEGEFAYSYVFDGQFGYLDYLMSSAPLTPQVTGATEWHINADEPDVYDYDTTFKSDYQISLFDPTSPYRASDHDAALSGLALDLDADVVLGVVAARIEQLGDAGDLSRGERRSLTRRIEQALELLDSGTENGALGVLDDVRSDLVELGYGELALLVEAVRSGIG